MVQDEKQTSTIVLTTHSMEEADLLGDTLGVMDKGKMQAQGTSLELKKKYGSGYGLNIVKTTDDVSVDKITAVVQEFVSTAAVRTDIGTEVTYTLPIDQSSNFAKLFIKLNSESDSLGLATFGLTQTSLEEVFLNLAKLHDDEDDEDAVRALQIQHAISAATTATTSGLIRLVPHRFAWSIELYLLSTCGFPFFGYTGSRQAARVRLT